MDLYICVLLLDTLQNVMCPIGNLYVSGKGLSCATSTASLSEGPDFLFPGETLKLSIKV